MIVVFDTNVWLSQLGLRSSAASGVRFFLKHHNFKVALPEVIRMEVEVNLRSKLIKHIESVRDSHDQLLTAFQMLHDVILPSEADVEDLIPQLFSSIGVPVINVPFSIKSAKSSLLKTIHKEQPSHNGQQFKDGVIWADCLALLETDDVTLVTADKAFYAGANFDDGLADNLRREAAACPHHLRIVDSLPKLLEKVSKHITFNDDKLIEIALGAASISVSHYLRSQFGIDLPVGITKSLFATEDPSKLFFACSLAIPCHDMTELDRTGALLTILVDGIYSWETQEFDTVDMVETSFTYMDEHGLRIDNKGVWARTAGVGHGMVKSVIREPVHK